MCASVVVVARRSVRVRDVSGRFGGLPCSSISDNCFLETQAGQSVGGFHAIYRFDEESSNRSASSISRRGSSSARWTFDGSGNEDVAAFAYHHFLKSTLAQRGLVLFPYLATARIPTTPYSSHVSNQERLSTVCNVEDESMFQFLHYSSAALTSFTFSSSLFHFGKYGEQIRRTKRAYSAHRKKARYSLSACPFSSESCAMQCECSVTSQRSRSQLSE